MGKQKKNCLRKTRKTANCRPKILTLILHTKQELLCKMEVDQDTEMQPSSSHTSGKCEKKSFSLLQSQTPKVPWYYKSCRNITFETKILIKRKIVKMPKDMSVLDQRKSNPNGDEDEDPEQSSDTSEMGEEEMNSEEALEVLSESLGLTQHQTDRSRITAPQGAA